MVMHAEAPPVEVKEQAGSRYLAFLLHKGTGLDALDNYYQRLYGGEDCQALLDKIKAMTPGLSTCLAIAMTRSTVDYSRADSLIEDYSWSKDAERPTIIVPASRITGANILELGSIARPDPALDIRVQTTVTDATPVELYNGNGTPISEEHPGMWHRFPLKLAEVAVIS